MLQASRGTGPGSSGPVDPGTWLHILGRTCGATVAVEDAGVLLRLLQAIGNLVRQGPIAKQLFEAEEDTFVPGLSGAARVVMHRADSHKPSQHIKPTCLRGGDAGSLLSCLWQAAPFLCSLSLWAGGGGGFGA